MDGAQDAIDGGADNRHEEKRLSLRARLLLGLGVAVAVIGSSYGAYEHFFGAKYVSTDNAYVGADSAQVTAQTGGIVKRVAVSDTQAVKAGDILVELDTADARANVASAKANLDRTVLTVKQAFANNNALEAQMRQRQADLARARDDLTRRTRLSNGGAVSAEEVAHARDTLASAAAGLRAARAQWESGIVLTNGFTVENHPDILRARAQLETAELDLSRTTITAPTTGVVTRRSVQLGQRVAAGAALMTIVPVDALYVDANFKEVEVAHIRPGQTATLIADVYGSSVKFRGHVIGLSGGTGSAFALIPAQNATGNWIKVVQRIPVRIALDPAELRAHPLRVGVSMQVEIDISSTLAADKARSSSQGERL